MCLVLDPVRLLDVPRPNDFIPTPEPRFCAGESCRRRLSLHNKGAYCFACQQQPGKNKLRGGKLSLKYG